VAGASAVVVNRPVLAELTDVSGEKVLKVDRADNVRHIWQLPHNLHEKVTFDDRLNMEAVSKYCALLERYFQPVQWHSGRMAVAVGAFLAYALGPDDAQRYLALMTVFEALLSTDSSEIIHQISERAAFMLETTEEGRDRLYKRMKKLYKTRSLLVHGAIDNKHGVITYNDLRLDAKMSIVPEPIALRKRRTVYAVVGLTTHKHMAFGEVMSQVLLSKILGNRRPASAGHEGVDLSFSL